MGVAPSTTPVKASVITLSVERPSDRKKKGRLHPDQYYRQVCVHLTYDLASLSF